MGHANQSIHVDVSRIESAETRRAIRMLLQQLEDVIAHQQTQIEALVELITEKHVASLSEFRRAVQQITDRSNQRSERIHSQISAVLHTPPPVPREASAEEPEEETRQVYRL
jgi:uncharacterized coiled-coil protein SlyX